MIPPPRWTEDQLRADLERAIERFRADRMQEPLEAYLTAFDEYRRTTQELLDATADLAGVEEAALRILTDARLLEALRYVPGPPLSRDDLRTVANALLSPTRLRSDPDMVRRILHVIRMGLDSRRFPWLSEERQATQAERAAAVLASAALMATSRVGTARRNLSKTLQEGLVEDALLGRGLRKMPVREIATLTDAPRSGEFCRESLLGTRKADFVIGLWDRRVMAVECKVSNSATNSVKRLNNDAAAKAEQWLHDFGKRPIIPAAVLSGVYKLHNLIDAQERGLTLFWAHDLAELVSWIEQTRG